MPKVLQLMEKIQLDQTGEEEQEEEEEMHFRAQNK